MKKPSITFLSVSIFLLIGISSCDKEEIKIDPRKAILGKWEITHIGNGDSLRPVENPIAYAEYLPDSVLLGYNYEEDRFFYWKYWLTDSLLVQSFVFIDSIDNDTIVFELPYKYDFISPNKLRLEFLIPTFGGQQISIHKRID